MPSHHVSLQSQPVNALAPSKGEHKLGNVQIAEFNLLPQRLRFNMEIILLAAVVCSKQHDQEVRFSLSTGR